MGADADLAILELLQGFWEDLWVIEGDDIFVPQQHVFPSADNNDWLIGADGDAGFHKLSSAVFVGTGDQDQDVAYQDVVGVFLGDLLSLGFRISNGVIEWLINPATGDVVPVVL